MPLASTWPLLTGALLTAAAGFAGGFALAERLADGRIAKMEARRIKCEQAREADARAAAEQAAQLLARAQGAEAEAAARLAAQQSAFERRLKEVRSEIYRLTTGRECLSGALRLRLNAAISSPGGLSADTGAAAHAAAGTAADPGISSPPGRRDGGEGATDSDIAGWIVDVAGLYEQCRARIDALREWDKVTHGR